MGHFLQILEEREEQPQKVLEKDPVGSKVLERNVCVSNSEIKAEKEQPDHEVFKNQFPPCKLVNKARLSSQRPRARYISERACPASAEMGQS